MNLLITICGRAGSKGLENKNIRNFLGKPLIAYTITAAELFAVSNRYDQTDICVNSDSDELLEFARRYGINCIERPEEMAQDSSPKVPAIRYSLVSMEEKLSRRYDYVIDLDITSPLRKVADIENALTKIQQNDKADVVFSVVSSRRNPYFNMVEEKNGKIQKIIDVYFPTRQQAPKVYDMNASIYCYRRDSLLNRLQLSPLEGMFDIILMKDTAVLDIDSEEDFELMELLAGHYFRDEFREIFEFTYHSF